MNRDAPRRTGLSHIPAREHQLLFFPAELTGPRITVDLAIAGAPYSGGIMKCRWAAAYAGRGIKPRLLALAAVADDAQALRALAFRGVILDLQQHFPTAADAPLLIRLPKCGIESKIREVANLAANKWVRSNGKPAKSARLWTFVLALFQQGRIEFKEFSGAANTPFNFDIADRAARTAKEQSERLSLGSTALTYADGLEQTFDENDVPSFEGERKGA